MYLHIHLDLVDALRKHGRSGCLTHTKVSADRAPQDELPHVDPQGHNRKSLGHLVCKASEFLNTTSHRSSNIDIIGHRLTVLSML